MNQESSLTFYNHSTPYPSSERRRQIQSSSREDDDGSQADDEYAHERPSRGGFLGRGRGRQVKKAAMTRKRRTGQMGDLWETDTRLDEQEEGEDIGAAWGSLSEGGKQAASGLHVSHRGQQRS